MDAPEVFQPQPQTLFSTPANGLLWDPSRSPASSPTGASPAVLAKPTLTLSTADYHSLQMYIATTIPLPQTYEAYKALYPDVLSPLTPTNLYSRTGQLLVSAAALTHQYQLSFSNISSIAVELIGFANEARFWYPRLQAQLKILMEEKSSNGSGGSGAESAKTVLSVLNNLAQRKEERIGSVVAQFSSLRTETLRQKSAAQDITVELSTLQDTITREYSERSTRLQVLGVQRGAAESERRERNRERNRALLGLGYMFADPLRGFLSTAITVSAIQSRYEEKKRERDYLDDEICCLNNALSTLQQAKTTTASLETSLSGIISVVDGFLDVCLSIKNTFRTMQMNFDLVESSLLSSCGSVAGARFEWAIEDLARAREVWEKIAETACEFQGEDFLKLCGKEGKF